MSTVHPYGPGWQGCTSCGADFEGAPGQCEGCGMLAARVAERRASVGCFSGKHVSRIAAQLRALNAVLDGPLTVGLDYMGLEVVSVYHDGLIIGRAELPGDNVRFDAQGTARRLLAAWCDEPVTAT